MIWESWKSSINFTNKLLSIDTGSWAHGVHCQKSWAFLLQSSWSSCRNNCSIDSSGGTSGKDTISTRWHLLTKGMFLLAFVDMYSFKKFGPFLKQFKLFKKISSESLEVPKWSRIPGLFSYCYHYTLRDPFKSGLWTGKMELTVLAIRQIQLCNIPFHEAFRMNSLTRVRVGGSYGMQVKMG